MYQVKSAFVCMHLFVTEGCNVNGKSSCASDSLPYEIKCRERMLAKLKRVVDGMRAGKRANKER